jgi:hypothetical protein
MVLEKILTEAEIGSLPEGIADKIESDYQAKLEAGVKAESKKTAEKFAKLLECVNNKVEEKINAAVESCVANMKTDAINTRMYAALQGVAGILENSLGVDGLGDTQTVKELKKELAKVNSELKETYIKHEEIADRLNKANAEMKLLNLCQGLDPNTVGKVLQHFRGHDEREITKESVSDYIQNHLIDDKNGFVIDVDPDPSDVNMDKIRSAIKDAEADDDFVLDFDNDDAPTSTPGQRKFMESIGHGLKPQKIGIPGTTVTLESIKQDAAESTDDVSIAMQQMAAFDELGIGGRFG